VPAKFQSFRRSVLEKRNFNRIDRIKADRIERIEANDERGMQSDE
jgi:hypothetical protein